MTAVPERRHFPPTWLRCLLSMLALLTLGLLDTACSQAASATTSTVTTTVTCAHVCVLQHPVGAQGLARSDGPVELGHGGRHIRGAAVDAPTARFVIAAEAGGGADNVVNGLRLRAQLSGDEIAGGHAFDKHIGEFPGISTRGEFARTIENVVQDGEMRSLSGGRTAYWRDGTVVIRDPGSADGGTAFRPTDGYGYFLGLH